MNDDFAAKPAPFPVFLESLRKIYLPRHYGLEHFGEPDKIKIKRSFDIDVKFVGKLRPIQLKPVEAFLKTCEEGTYSAQSYGGILALACGIGKCLGYDTPILMYNGKLIDEKIISSFSLNFFFNVK